MCCVGSSLTQQNKDGLEHTQKSLAKLVLGHKYKDYESALKQLGLTNLVIRRQNLMVKFAENGIETGKVKEFFQHRQTTHNTELRNLDQFETVRFHTKRLRNSSIPHMQMQLNQEGKT